MIDFRALCADLLQELEHASSWDYQQALKDQARAALAQPGPEGPTDEEIIHWVSDCADATRESEAEHYWAFEVPNDYICGIARAVLARWGTPNSSEVRRSLGDAPQPIPVSERLPEASVKVLAHYLNCLGKSRTVCAIWVPAKTRSEDSELTDDNFTEYDEETDTFYWPEGWYESIENWDELGYIKIDEGDVDYWQPLPLAPAVSTNS